MTIEVEQLQTRVAVLEQAMLILQPAVMMLQTAVMGDLNPAVKDLAAAMATVPTVVCTRRLVIVNKDGQPIAGIEVVDGAPRLFLTGENGQITAFGPPK